ncbi:MAG: metal ABC transporter solute-binding protein, Zn/Mn family [Gammaproteobacteria bacterium]
MTILQRLLLVLLTLFAFTSNTVAEEKINAFVSILPQQYFVEQVGGELVDVQVMVGPGQNPATYEPTPQQMAALAHADIYFSIGVPFEKAWLNKVKQTNDKLVVIECCESLSDLQGHSHHGHNHAHSHGHHDDELDPHIWTSPKKVIQLVKLIEDSLLQVSHSDKHAFKDTAENFVIELNKLDAFIRASLVDLKQRELIVSHPSWAYFAKEYNLSQISIEQNGKEIQAKSLVKLIKSAKEKNIKAVFVQQQFSDKAARIIAKELNADIYELDPLAFNYIENMNDVTSKIIKGLSSD